MSKARVRSQESSAGTRSHVALDHWSRLYHSSMIVASTAANRPPPAVRTRAIDRARIDDQRFAVPVDRRHVRVAVADEPISPLSIASRNRRRSWLCNRATLHAVEFQIAEQAVARLPGLLNRGRECVRIVIAIAEHKMRRPRGEQLDDRDRADIAAVQHGIDFEAFEHPHRRPRELDVAMRITDDAEPQSVFSAESTIQDQLMLVAVYNLHSRPRRHASAIAARLLQRSRRSQTP